MIQITVYSDEVLLRLDQFPRRLREALHTKFAEIFAQVSANLDSTTQGKYLDKNYIKTEITDIGSLTVGSIEVTDKPGVYSFGPSKKQILAFFAKSGDYVRTKRVYNHPYLKGTPIVARYLEEAKPWIIDQLENAVIEAL